MERVDPELFRGRKIFKERPGGVKRQNAFSQRVVNPWNKLSREEAMAGKTSSFKSRFNKKEDTRRGDREENRGRGGLYKRLYEQLH